MNKYKIDYNRYGQTYPFALYAKLHWYSRWEHIESFQTKEDAEAKFRLLTGLPIYLN